MPKINVNTIPDNTTIQLSGVVDFSQIAKRIEGAELDIENARRSKYGIRPESKPHTRMTISHAQVEFADANSPTLGEQFILEKFYYSPKYPAKNAMYSALNKGHSIPEVYARDTNDSTKLVPFKLENELAHGMRVTLIVRVFATKLNKGLSLDTVILDEPVRYRTNAVNSTCQNSLTARGYTIAAPAVPATPAVYSA